MAKEKKTEAAVKPVAAIKTPEEPKKETAKAAEKVATVKKAVTKKATTAKKAAETKVEEPVKEVAEKVEVKEEAKKEAPKKAEEPKKAPAKKAAAKETEVKANIVLQYGDKNVTYDTIVENSKNNYQFEMGGDANEIKKLSVYVKPEENAAYYVVNDKVQGRIGL